MTEKTEKTLPELMAENERMREALIWISRIADANIEQDQTLRARGARTLTRIADRAEDALNDVQPVSNPAD
jgi:hypothetical protein